MAQVFEPKYHIKHDRGGECISKDVVPRLPEYPFRHAGHTKQIDQSDESCCLAFYIVRETIFELSGSAFSWNVSPLFDFLRRSESIDQRT